MPSRIGWRWRSMRPRAWSAPWLLTPPTAWRSWSSPVAGWSGTRSRRTAGRSMVVFSDGEDLADHWRSRLDRLVRAGVIVHVVAIGDPEHGHPVPSGTGDQ